MERRAHPRKRVSTAVTFNDPGGAPLHGSLCDVGRGGCFIASPSHLTFGERVTLEMRLGGGLVTATGRVAWTRHTTERDRPAGMGIAFTDVSDASLAAIDGVRGSEVSLSQPRTFIGIAPPPRASSPAFTPPSDPKPIEDIDVALEELMARTEAEEPPPPPVIAAKPQPRARRRMLIAGGAVLAIVATALLAVGLRRHRTASVSAVDAAASAWVAASVVSVAGFGDAGADAQAPADAGTDGGRKPKKPTKPRHK
jgi:uncharacterized protein (TIGR02266 family)